MTFLQMGPNAHLLTFPVDHGNTLNMVAFKTNSEPWPDPQRLTRRATREDALKDYEGFGPNVMKLLNLTKPDLDVVSICQYHKSQRSLLM